MDTASLLDELEQRPQQAEQMSFEQLAAPSEDEPVAESHFHAPAGGRTSRAAEPAPGPAVTGRHQDVRLHLAVLFKTFVEMTDAGLVRDAPFQVRLSEAQVYEPDIVFVANSNFDRVNDAYIEGPPDLIVEVLSEESTAQDRGEKFVAYEAAGVREYWLIDPLRELTDLYILGPDSRFDEFRPDTAGRLRSRALRGFVLDTGQLWRRVLPTTLESVEMVQAMVSQR